MLKFRLLQLIPQVYIDGIQSSLLILIRNNLRQKDNNFVTYIYHWFWFFFKKNNKEARNYIGRYSKYNYNNFAVLYGGMDHENNVALEGCVLMMYKAVKARMMEKIT